jgi:coenzyme F420 biosynthesis associated uncharacterized protein
MATTFASDRLVDWGAARAVGARTAGAGPVLTPIDRARLNEDFAELVAEAHGLVEGFTLLTVNGYRSRPWVMTRSEWLQANLRGFHGILEPFAAKVLRGRSQGTLARARRAAFGAQIGGLMGYLGRKVLGQYDLFLPPDDDGTLYFVGPNVAGVERRFAFPERDFRSWLSLHEVAHRVQFGSVPWLRAHVSGLMHSYLNSVELDPKRLLETLRRARQEVRSGHAGWRGLGWMFLLMSPDQRDLFARMQAVMSLLEGHGNFVMNGVGEGRIPDLALFRSRLRERRQTARFERTFQRAIGFDAKVRQYDVGERFVASVVERAGMEGFNRVWEAPTMLPTLEEIGRPEVWLARVGTG